MEVETSSAKASFPPWLIPCRSPHVATRSDRPRPPVGRAPGHVELERDLISTTPLAFRVGTTGFAVLLRLGVVVLIGLSPLEEDEVVRAVPRLTGRYARSRTRPRDHRDRLGARRSGRDRRLDLAQGSVAAARVVIADVLAKNVALVRNEREANKVLELIEPFANRLAATGRTPVNRREMLRVIGQTCWCSTAFPARGKTRSALGSQQPTTLVCAPGGRIRAQGTLQCPAAQAPSSRRGRRALVDIIDTERFEHRLEEHRRRGPDRLL